MEVLALLPIAAAVLLAAGYAHRRLPGLSGSVSGLWLARGLLVGTGVGFGLAMVASASVMAGDLGIVTAMLVFLSGFGVVHVPAALIMIIKRARRKQGAGPQEPDDWP